MSNGTSQLVGQLAARLANNTFVANSTGTIGELASHEHAHDLRHQVGASDQATPIKLIAGLVLFLITMLCGYVPVRMILNQNVIQHAMFAGGGVLMATAFCHLIPEAHDNYKQGTRAHEHAHEHELQQADGRFARGLSVPYLEVTLCCGFFFMYLVEQLMVRFINNHSHEHPCDGHARASSGRLTNFVSLAGEEAAKLNARQDSCHSSGPDSSAGSTSVGNLSVAAMLAPNELQARPGRSGSFELHGAQVDTRASEFYKFLRGLLIVSAFGAHSIFDGVAIGSQETPEKVWTIFFAISCHKLIIVAVVGLELFAATLESHLWTLVHLALFSLMSPLGILLVVLAQSSLQLSSTDPAMILLQSFATGTLLYIIFVEILQPKQAGNEPKVNGNSPSCLFNELALDRHVKYQSAINSSWFIGFDRLGEPMRAGAPAPLRPTNRSAAEQRQLEATARERCFSFTKSNKLSASAQLFPKALELAARRGPEHQTGQLLASLSDTSRPVAQAAASNRTATLSEHELRAYQQAQLASLAKRRGGSQATFVPLTFQQRQLIDMACYRNKLRYYVGRAAGQPLLAVNESSLAHEPAALFESRATPVAA